MVTFNLFRFLASVLFAFGGIIIGIYMGAELMWVAEKYGYTPGILTLLPAWGYYLVGLALWLLAYRFQRAGSFSRNSA